MSSVHLKSELEQKLQEIKKQEEEQTFQLINECLERWRVQLAYCPRHKKDTSQYELSITHHPQARARVLQWGGGRIDFLNKETNKWDWRIYSKCDTHCANLCIYANTKEELLPNAEDILILSGYGITFTITALQPRESVVLQEIYQLTAILSHMKTNILTNTFNSYNNKTYAYEGSHLANMEEEGQKEVAARIESNYKRVGQTYDDEVLVKDIKQCIEICNNHMKPTKKIKLSKS